MNRFFALALLIIIVGLTACGGSEATARPTPRPTTAWYDGGTLHSATVGEWKVATDANNP